MKYLIALSMVGAFALNAPAQETANSNRQARGAAEGSLPPGLQQREQLPPGLNRGGTLPPGLAKRQSGQTPTQSEGTNTTDQTQATTAWGSTNTSTMAAGGTNSFGSGLTPTSDTNRTDRVYGTNQTNQASASATTTTQTTVTRQDQAYTQADKRLLVQVRQTVLPIIGESVATSSTTTAAPVHFIIREQTVIIVGQVPTVEQSHRIEAAVEKVPGIVRVENQLRVTSETRAEVGSSTTTTESTIAGTTGTNASGATAPASTNQFGGTTNTGSGLTPTSSRTNGMTSVYPANTNQWSGTNSPGLSPTGRTNLQDTVPQGLPPGLQKRDQLPPGLEKRDQLPPGLEKRTGSENDSGTDKSSQ